MWSIVIGDEPQTKRITARMLLAIAEQQGMADHPILVSLGGGQATFVAEEDVKSSSAEDGAVMVLDL